MEPREVNIEKIEAYLQGALNTRDRVDFEKEIQSDSTLAKEVEAYRTLFKGFSGLADNEFKNKMADWSNEWKAEDGEETMLIEAYLNDNLHPNLKKETDKRIQSDASFAKKVEQYKTLLSGLSGLKGQEFKSKMESWENKAQTSSTPTLKAKPKTKILNLYRKIAIAASFLLIIGVGSKWHATTNYAPQVLVADAYHKPETGGTLGNDDPTLVELVETQFATAHELMENSDYEDAVEAFDNVLRSLESADLPQSKLAFLNDNSKWSKALALLSDNGDDDEIKEILKDIIDTSKDSYYTSEANKLLKKMNSFWYKIN
jgi:anti-sigma-K factor RskA